MAFSRTNHNAGSAPATVRPLSSAVFEAIRQFDTCTIANAIEHFRVRLRNEGFTRPGLRCATGGSPYASPDIGGSADRTLQVAGVPVAGVPQHAREIIDLCQSPQTKQ